MTAVVYSMITFASQCDASLYLYYITRSVPMARYLRKRPRLLCNQIANKVNCKSEINGMAWRDEMCGTMKRCKLFWGEKR